MVQNAANRTLTVTLTAALVHHNLATSQGACADPNLGAVNGFRTSWLVAILWQSIDREKRLLGPRQKGLYRCRAVGMQWLVARGFQSVDFEDSRL